MALPETIRVKISSEVAESIAMTPVVAREMPLRELLEAMLGVAGKDAERIHELLGRGSLVAGASRFRWQGWDADRAALGALLGTFPDPDPQRVFEPSACVRIVLVGPRTRIEVSRETGRERRLFRKICFWDAVLEAAAAGALRYGGYSYRERADRYDLEVSPAGAARLRESAAAIRYSTLESQVRQAHIDRIELYAVRE